MPQNGTKNDKNRTVKGELHMKDTNWKEYFNGKADTYKGSVKTSDYFNEKSFYIQRENTLKWLGELKGLTVLDAGCGVGAFSETLVKDNKVYGVDFSEKSLEFAKQRGLEGYCADLMNLPFEDGKFDLVLCIGVIQLIKEYAKVLKELSRVVKPGGTMLIETLNKHSLQRKALSLVDKTKKFDMMFDSGEIKGIYSELGFRDIEFMNIYHPFEFVKYSSGQGVFNKCMSTSFAVKGIKA